MKKKKIIPAVVLIAFSVLIIAAMSGCATEISTTDEAKTPSPTPSKTQEETSGSEPGAVIPPGAPGTPGKTGTDPPKDDKDGQEKKDPPSTPDESVWKIEVNNTRKFKRDMFDWTVTLILTGLKDGGATPEGEYACEAKVFITYSMSGEGFNLKNEMTGEDSDVTLTVRDFNNDDFDAMPLAPLYKQEDCYSASGTFNMSGSVDAQAQVGDGDAQGQFSGSPSGPAAYCLYINETKVEVIMPDIAGAMSFTGTVTSSPKLAQDTADETEGIDPADIQKNKTMGGLAYILFFLPLLVCPESKYGRFHANQGLIYLFLCIAGSIVNRVLSSIFITISWRLWGITSIISAIIWLPILVVGIIGLINGFSGKAKGLPIIGKFRIIK